MDRIMEEVNGNLNPTAEALYPNKRPQDAGEAMEVILEHAGVMGRYQRCLFAAMLPCGLMMAGVYFLTIFIVATPQGYWCRIPELGHLDQESKRNLSAPGAITGGDWDRCRTFDANWSDVLETMQPPLDAPLVTCKHGWEFQLEKEDIPYETVVTERGWVCEYGTNVPLTQMAFFAGAFCGGLVFGWMADRVGRVPALVAVNLVGFVGSMSCIFTRTHWDFALCRFIAGLCFDNCFMLIYILVLEYVGAQHRTWVANLSIMLYYGGGAIMLPWLALWLSNWRMLVVVTSLPALFVLAAPFVLPESARWLSSRGQHNRAVKMLRRLERINGTHIPQQAIDDFVALTKSEKDNTADESLKAMLSRPRLLVLLLLNVVLFSLNGLVFDSLVRMSGSFGADMFITFTISSATEVPSLLLVVLLLDRIGRRTMAAGTLTMAGIVALIAAFVPKGSPRAWLAITARFLTNMSVNTHLQWVTELLPTGARAAGSSLVHVAAFLMATLSPFVVYLEQHWSGLPLVITGVEAMLAAGVSTLLPETRTQAMPHSCADVERLLQHSLLSKLMGKSRAEEDIEDKPNKEKQNTSQMRVGSGEL